MSKAFRFALVAVWVALPFAVLAQPAFSAADCGALGTLSGSHTVSAMNNNGDVVGRYSGANGQPKGGGYACIGGVFHDLGAINHMAVTVPVAISDSDVVIGNMQDYLSLQYGDGVSVAFMWQNGSMTQIGNMGGYFSQASAINASGLIAGVSTTLDGYRHAWVYQGGTLTDLGNPGGTGHWIDVGGINDNGTVAGTFLAADNTYHVYSWTAGTMSDMGQIPGQHQGIVSFINNSGEIVGSYSTGVSGGYSSGQGTFIENGGGFATISTLVNGGYETDIPFGVNSSGHVVISANDFYGLVNKVVIDEGGSFVDVHDGGQFTSMGPVGITDSDQVALNGGYPFGGYIWQGGNLTQIPYLPAPQYAGMTASAINRSGTVAGISMGSDRNEHPVLYQNGALQDLGVIQYSQSTATGVNSHGTVVGTSILSNGNPHAFMFQNGVMTDLGTLGGPSSSAIAINESGQVIGYTQDSIGNRAFIYSNGTMTDLGNLGVNVTYPVAINDVGEVAGLSEAASLQMEPFIWKNGVMRQLYDPTPPNNLTTITVTGVNNQGAVIGYYQVNYVNRACMWQPDGTFVDLQSEIDPVPYTNSQALAINDAGQVVGYASLPSGYTHAVIWQNGAYTDLGTFGGKYTYSSAIDIDSAGNIFAQGSSPSPYHYFTDVAGASTDYPDLSSLQNSQSYVSSHDELLNAVGQAADPQNANVSDPTFYSGGSTYAIDSVLQTSDTVLMLQLAQISKYGGLIAGNGIYNGNDHAILLTPIGSVDKAAPVTTASVAGPQGPNGAYTADPQVTLNPTDADGAGDLAGTFYTIDGTQYSYAGAPFAVPGDGNHMVTYWSTDRHFNTESAHSLSLKIDTSAPTTTSGLLGKLGNAGWYRSPVQVTLNASDPDGGADVANTSYTLDGTTPKAYSGPFRISTTGAHAISFHSVDQAGNAESAKTVSFNEDVSPPVTAASVTTGSKTNVALSATDQGSGVLTTRFIFDGGAQHTYSGPITIPPGPHALAFWSIDVAGNTEDHELLSVTAPYPVPVLNSRLPGSAYAGQGDVTLTITGSRFYPTSVVTWGGAPLATAYASPTSLLARLPASDLTAVGTFQVGVFTPGPGGGSSRPLNFSVVPPRLCKLELSAYTVKGGSKMKLLAGINFPALTSPPATISLSSNNSCVALPATVTITPGQATYLLSFAPSTVSAPTPVTITAAMGAVTRSVVLNVTP